MFIVTAYTAVENWKHQLISFASIKERDWCILGKLDIIEKGYY